ncbi:MAG: hypothetical protein LBR12_02905, partial [Opitutaceae bacterium]|nr:hypothetical protein [Opitutaceae bacterium]
KRVQSLHASVVEEITLEVSIYQNADNTLRLQVSFLPQPRNRLTTALGFSTNTTAGDTFVTDNHFLPFAGFYPENWRLERRPLVRSAARLLRIHQTRLAQAGAGATPWTTEPLADLNAHQAELERVNTELGFLSKTAEREEQGSITPAGRYRIWKEYWLLNYLGRSARYV